jgi:hypothetical protein
MPPKIINFHNWHLMKIFLTFGFGASGGTSQVPIRYRQPFDDGANLKLSDFQQKDKKT